MKKKILIVSDSLNMGGLEKCLLNVCDNLDYSKYEVDLYLFNEGRTLLEKLNKNVNLLPDSPYYKDVYNTSIMQSVKTLIKKKKPFFAFYRIIRFLRARMKDYAYRSSDWRVMQKTMLRIDKKYDVAIGFAEGTASYYVADCVNADVKIGCFHTDLKRINHNWNLDEHAFQTLDRVVTVSKNSLKSLKEIHPDCKEKFVCIYLPALMDYDEMDRLSLERNCMDDENAIKIISVGRLVELKGFHLCVEPCRKLIDEGFNVKWYIAGEGEYRQTIESLVKKNNLENNFILLGNCHNPYTYIRSADICVQPSSYEGFSLSVIEGKHFKKPMVVSDIPSNMEMIKDGFNGFVVKRDENEIYAAVKRLVADAELRQRLGNEPTVAETDNKVIMQSFENLFKGE